MKVLQDSQRVTLREYVGGQVFDAVIARRSLAHTFYVRLSLTRWEQVDAWDVPVSLQIGVSKWKRKLKNERESADETSSKK